MDSRWEDQLDWGLSLLARAEAERIMGKLHPKLELFGSDWVLDEVSPWLHRDEAFPHTLIVGVPGLGKTHLARWIAQEREAPLTEVMCPTEPSSVETDGIVLLDEIHRQNRSEWLFPIMEASYNTIIGATTKPQALDPALASRFFIKIRLRRMGHADMVKMMAHLCPQAPHDDIEVLAGATAGNPRQAHRLAATANAIEDWEPGFAKRVLKIARINADGLGESQLRYLMALHRAGRPLGIGQLATLVYSDEDTIREDELLLIEYDLITLSKSGRMLTAKGERYVKSLQGTL